MEWGENVFVNCFFARDDSPAERERYLAWLDTLADGPAPKWLAVWSPRKPSEKQP